VEGRICGILPKGQSRPLVGYSTGKTIRAGLGWGNFKEMIKDHFYPTSLQKAKENEFMQL